MNSELYFNQKKYISAKRGSEITGYTSDYIGQLCRANKLDCRLVGRAWFVAEDSIIEHQKIASQKARGTIQFPPIADSLEVPIPPTFTPPSSTLSSLFSQQEKSVFFGFFLFFIVGFIFLSAFFVQQKQYQMVVAHISERVILETSAFFKDLFTEKTLEQSATAYVAETSFLFKEKISSLGVFFENLALGVYKTISSLFFNRVHTVVVRDDRSTHTPLPQKDRTGLIVVPGTGDKSQDDAITENIKNSFSDETEVYPDETGNSGVIKPIFKKQSDQEYLYVMVPIDE